MNTSPNQRNSPKEKRSFTFFRSRTLSASSNDSSNNGAVLASATVNNNNNNNGSTSPRLSPRSIFDRVRKRSQSDAVNSSGGNNKSPQNSIEHINQQKFQENLQLHLQQQLIIQQQKQLLEMNGRKLTHSISEENDADYYNDVNNNTNNNARSTWPNPGNKVISLF
jgi:hypothetical protein